LDLEIGDGASEHGGFQFRRLRILCDKVGVFFDGILEGGFAFRIIEFHRRSFGREDLRQKIVNDLGCVWRERWTRDSLGEGRESGIVLAKEKLRESELDGGDGHHAVGRIILDELLVGRCRARVVAAGEERVSRFVGLRCGRRLSE